MQTLLVTSPWKRATPIEVDTTNLNSDGLLRVRRSRFGGALPAAGRRVSIVDSVNEIQGTAFMVNHNERTDLVYLHIDWDQMREVVSVPASVTYGLARTVEWTPERVALASSQLGLGMPA